MSSTIHKLKPIYFNHLNNILIFVFFFTLLFLNKGYSHIPITLGIIGVIYIVIQIYKSKTTIKTNKENKLFSYLVIFYFITFLTSTLVHQDTLRELDKPAKLLLLLPTIIIFSHFPIKFRTLIYAIPIGSAISGLYALYQKFILSHHRAFISYYSIQAGDIAIILAFFTLAITIYLYQKKEPRYIIILSTISSLLGFIASGLSNARGGWVTLPVIIFLIVIHNKHISKKFISGILISIIAVITILYNIPQTSVAAKIGYIRTQTNLYIEKNNAQTSIGARLEMWHSAILGIKEKPLLGWGQKGYLALKQQQAEKNLVAKSITTFNDAHNQYLDTLVKRGVLGFIGLLAIFLIPIHYFYKKIKDIKIENRLIASLGIYHIISTMIFCLTQSFLNHSSGIIFYVFIIILLYSNIQNNEK